MALPPNPPVRYIVEGGHRLSGSIEPMGNKNAALPIIAAALLTDQRVTLENVPRIRDVEALVQLGVVVDRPTSRLRDVEDLLLHDGNR